MMVANSFLTERARVDVLLPPIAFNGASTSMFRSMKYFEKAFIHTTLNAAAIGTTCVTQVRQSVTSVGGTPADLTGALSTITGGTKAHRVKITMNTVSVDDTITLNGIVFTAKASENLTLGYFNQASTDAAAATSLAACINAAFGDDAEILADASSAVVTLTPDDPETGDITIAASAVARTIPTCDHHAVVEVAADRMTNATKTALGVIATTNASTVCGVIMIREQSRKPISNMFSDSYMTKAS